MKKRTTRKSMKIRPNPPRSQRIVDVVVSGRGSRKHMVLRVWSDGELVGSNSGLLDNMMPGFNKHLGEAAQEMVFGYGLEAGDKIRFYAAKTPESRRRMIRSWTVAEDRSVAALPVAEEFARPNPAGVPGTFRFGRSPFGVFNHGDTMVHGDVWAYVDVFDAKRRPIGGGIAITAIPSGGGKRGPVWVFPVPDGRDAPYLDGQAHTERGRVWASARWASADHDAVIVSTTKKSAR